MQEQIELLIEHLLDKGFTYPHHIYKNHIGWVYYYSVTGWINGKYFSLCLCKLRHDLNHETDIAEITDCKRDLKKILKQFKLI